ncbi:hypothetical protein BW730_14660 [Tessaracoccus aquimaris]|uniref:Uncharacterized protein n=1 Tax=Tessaracoccus aquimaris TaxID=1332264 RepID=A0A1Q2CR20_9ACTN|nr:hypothetical protein [Tessaracoccus aquimaris]AQP48557.1 hypothetical protein BW730_14660 [Tessaracoccus aquimaris]
MDVYSQDEQRAHGTGFIGIDAESDDAIDSLEVYEALINPREADQRGGQGGPGMMPPMMGMGGGGAGAAAPGGAGLSTAAANTAAASMVGKATPLTMPGVAPTLTGPAAASAGLGVGTAAGLGAGGGGSPSGLPAGGMPDGMGEAPPGGLEAAQVSEEPAAEDATEEVPQEQQTPPSTPTDATLNAGPGPDETAIDPAEVDRVAKEWSGLAQEMATIGSAASELQASLEDFGLVQQPAGPYGEMTSGIQQLAGGASKEFDEIATGLSYGAQAYRDHEAAAAATARSAQ